MTSPIKPDHAVSQQVLISLKEGDRFAFEFIYNKYVGRLFSFVNAKIRAKEISEELIQEIFVSLWANRESLEIQTSIEAYLFGAARNQVLNYIRKEYVRRQYAEEFSRFARDQFDNSLVDQTNLADLQKAIEVKVDELPGQCQVAFRRSRMEHTPVKEIAKEMNVSTRTVENYISQALRHLRTSLGELLSLFIICLLS